MVAGVGDVGREPAAALVLRLGHLLQPGAAAGALVAVGGIAAREALEPAAGRQLVDAIDDGVEEAAVVRDHEQGAVVRAEEPLEPGEAVGVEVVGRLVEQQHLRVLQQRRGQQRAGLLAAREPRERAVAGQVVDREPVPDLVGAGLGGPGVRGLGALEGVRVAVEVAGLAERGERLAGLPERVVEQRVERRVARGRLLRQVADARGRRDRSAVGVLAARQQAQQRRLARAVGADEAGSLAGVEGQREPIEEGRAVIALGQIECAKHG